MLNRFRNKTKEFTDFIKDSSKYGPWVLFKSLIGLNRLYLQDYYVNKVLDFAKKRDLRFTFFMTAKNIEKKMPVIKRMIAEGHEIGSHSYNHILHGEQDYARIKEEINHAQQEFKKAGIKPEGFRAPFLSMNEDVIRVIGEIGMKYSSNKCGGKIFKHINDVTEVPIIAPYDWEAFTVRGMCFEELMKKWNSREGAYLLHPWIFTKYLERFMKEKLKKGKDYRIKANLKKGRTSVSFDVY